MRRYEVLLLLVALFLGGMTPASLAPRPDRPAVAGEGLSRHELFAQIDSLQALARRQEGPARAESVYAIAQRLLATNLLKHRRHALELLEEAARLDPTLYAPRRLMAATAARMHYDRQALKWYGQLGRDFPARSLSWRLLGDLHFLLARRTLDAAAFEEAERAHARALRVDPADLEARVRLAGDRAALQRWDGLDTLLAPACRDSVWAAVAFLLRACGRTRRGDERGAWEDFHHALARADSATREVFVYGRRFFQQSRILEDQAARLSPDSLAAALRRLDPRWREEDGLNAEKALQDSTILRQALENYWRGKNPWPTHLSNQSRLRYWSRLVEAELLFGRPEDGLRGWDRAPGRAWVRWGRPSATLYLPASNGSRSDDLATFFFEPGMILPPSTVGVWAWDYRSAWNHFSILFEDRVMNGDWLAHDSTARLLRNAQKRQPILLISDAEAGDEPSFGIALDTAAFHRPRGATTLESYILVRRKSDSGDARVTGDGKGDGDGGFQLEWAVFDEHDRRVEYEKRTVGPADRIDRLRRAMGLVPDDGDADAWVVSLAADLPPGGYRVAVDVLDPSDGAHRSREVRLVIPLREEGTLSISDLELASTFQGLSGEEDLPPSLVKHAFGILPLVDGVLPADARRLAVYYEVYNLQKGMDGLTHFNVDYRVYRRRGGGHDWNLHDGDVVDLTPLDPVGARFLDESTAVSGWEHVVKGGALDVSTLGPGRYVLEIVIADQVSGRLARSWAPFVKKAGPRSPSRSNPLPATRPDARGSPSPRTGGRCPQDVGDPPEAPGSGLEAAAARPSASASTGRTDGGPTLRRLSRRYSSFRTNVKSMPFGPGSLLPAKRLLPPCPDSALGLETTGSFPVGFPGHPGSRPCPSPRGPGVSVRQA